MPAALPSRHLTSAERARKLLGNRITIKLDQPVENRIAEKAGDAGLDLETYIAHVVKAHAAKPTLKELSGEVYQQFVASGMTDEELGEFLELAKHEMRADRRRRTMMGNSNGGFNG